ncbi:phosphoglycerate mutase-like protein [Crassisporium funariophilum]|nr:phosphoglycerate mutase-like protein [Crassisporium funariophilum]
MVHFLLIRHAETKDNVNGVWAGWKDSPLSNHGMIQAQTLAKALSDIKLSAVHSSDLKRTRTTATVLISKQSNTNLPLMASALLREQNFGAGEGMKISAKSKDLSLATHFVKGRFPAIHTRNQRFPGGESLDEVAQRAEEVIDGILLPYVVQEREDQDGSKAPVLVAVVSHGIFIAELVAAMLRRRHPEPGFSFDVRNLRGMRNTGWTKVEMVFQPARNFEGADAVSLPMTLTTKILAVNRHTHLLNLVRQKGGIGSMVYDPSQKKIGDFFAKPKKNCKEDPVEVSP